jgi:predicted GIY-YIG superfamily endonuclease
MKKIYILKLLNNKYYIGIISNLDRRIGEYFDGYGTQWIKLNKPINIIDNIDFNSEFDKDKYIKNYMNMRCINNIRDSTYLKINLYSIEKINIMCEL